MREAHVYYIYYIYAVVACKIQRAGRGASLNGRRGNANVMYP